MNKLQRFVLKLEQAGITESQVEKAIEALDAYLKEYSNELKG